MTFQPRNWSDARRAYAQDQAMLESLGIHNLPSVQGYMVEAWRKNVGLAMDALPTLVTDPNSAIPAILTTMIDPQVYHVLFTPNQAADILGEQKKGSWLDDTAVFPIVENTGTVSSYGDYNNNGRASANTNWPQRQNYVFQTIKEYGERELARAGLAKINWVSEIDISAATVLDKFSNLSYFFGIAGLQNYGLLNDPQLTASLTPAPKINTPGSGRWITSGVVTATANEIYADIQSLFLQLVNQSAGLVDQKAKMTLAMSPQSEVALTATNAFAVNVTDLLKKNFPGMTVKTAVQYGQLSASNPQGVVAGNLVQLLVESVEGQKTGYCAFSEKQRSHPVVRDLSSFKQKVTAGTWGSIIRQPFGIASMIGV